MPWTFRVEAGHIRTFARAICDPNPAYADDESAAARRGGGLLAPPTFTVAGAHFDPDYDRRPKPDEPWIGSGRATLGTTQGPVHSEGGSGFHAEQIFEYHLPLRAGDELSAETRPGRHWEKRGRRGGRLLFEESVTEFRNSEGELVVTSTEVSVRTEKPV